MNIGDTVYRFDVNRRVYKDKAGNRTTGPIYSKHFVPVEIVNQTTRSWITKCGGKIPKSGKNHSNFFTLQGMEDDIWEKEHSNKVAEKLRSSDANTIRRVAELIGYIPQT